MIRQRREIVDIFDGLRGGGAMHCSYPSLVYMNFAPPYWGYRPLLMLRMIFDTVKGIE